MQWLLNRVIIVAKKDISDGIVLIRQLKRSVIIAVELAIFDVNVLLI